MKDELRAMTKNQRSFDSAVMMSSLMPSEKYSCSGSPLMLVNGSTAMAGRSGSGNTEGAALLASGPAEASLRSASSTAPTNRTPLRATVRISRCSSPVSFKARRAALMRLVSVDSDTTRPFQTASSRSSLRHHALAVAHQKIDEIEHLRLDGDQRVRPAQLAPLRIEHEILEPKRQRFRP